MILGKNTKIPQTGITVLSHAQATPQNITAGKQRLLKKLLIELFLFTDLTQGFSMQYAINIVKFISYIIQRNICYWIILLWCISCLSIQNWARCVDCEKHPTRLLTCSRHQSLQIIQFSNFFLFWFFWKTHFFLRHSK